MSIPDDILCKVCDINSFDPRCEYCANYSKWDPLMKDMMIPILSKINKEIKEKNSRILKLDEKIEGLEANEIILNDSIEFIEDFLKKKIKLNK